MVWVVGLFVSVTKDAVEVWRIPPAPCSYTGPHDTYTPHGPQTAIHAAHRCRRTTRVHTAFARTDRGASPTPFMSRTQEPYTRDRAPSAWYSLYTRPASRSQASLVSGVTLHTRYTARRVREHTSHGTRLSCTERRSAATHTTHTIASPRQRAEHRHAPSPDCARCTINDTPTRHPHALSTPKVDCNGCQSAETHSYTITARWISSARRHRALLKRIVQ